MSIANNDELEGTTYKVYLFAIKEGKPVNTRTVRKGLDLSSPSVAFRHLQKLETLGLLEKTAYGDYIVKEKVNVSGHIWIGRNLIPRLLMYSLFFVGLLGAEIAIILIRFFESNQLLDVNFIYLTVVTAIGVGIFSTEGLLIYLKNKTKFKG